MRSCAQSQRQEEMKALSAELRDVRKEQDSLTSGLNILKREKSIQIIQKHGKAVIQGRERENYRRIRAATIILQAAYRGMKTRQFNHLVLPHLLS
ncbi:hypothetical protein FKM82_024427 [Ascaphus truei]